MSSTGSLVGFVMSLVAMETKLIFGGHPLGRSEACDEGRVCPVCLAWTLSNKTRPNKEYPWSLCFALLCLVC